MLEWLRARTPRPAAGDDDDRLFDEEFQKRLEYLAVVSRRVFSGRQRAERRSKRTGAGVEFADYRHYSPGDDYRYLDWNVYGRLGRLLLRLFEEEEDLSIYILVDCSSSMTPERLRYAKRLAAAISYIGLSHLDRVAISAFSDAVRYRLPPTRGKNRIFKIFEFLTPIEAAGQTSLLDVAKTFAAQNKRKGVVVLISDLFDPAGFEQGINALRYAKFELFVLHISDPPGLDPALRGDVTLVDVETGDTRDVTATAALLEQYRKAKRAFDRRLEEFCRTKQVPLFHLDPSVPFEDAMLRILRRGGMVS